MKVRSIDSLGTYLREQRRTAELSLRQLAERAGVSNPYLSQVERGLRKPSAEVLSQLAKALSVSAEVMYVRAGLLDPDESDEQNDNEDTVPRAIRADQHLAERHKQVLLEIYESFRAETAVSGAPTATDAAAVPDVPSAPTASAPTAGAARTASAPGTAAGPGAAESRADRPTNAAGRTTDDHSRTKEETS